MEKIKTSQQERSAISQKTQNLIEDRAGFIQQQLATSKTAESASLVVSG